MRTTADNASAGVVITLKGLLAERKYRYHRGMNVKEIIQSLGGPTAVSRHLDVRPQAVSLWVVNEQIPLERVPALLRLAADQQVPINPEDLRGDYDWAAVCGCRTAAA